MEKFNFEKSIFFVRDNAARVSKKGVELCPELLSQTNFNWTIN